MSSSAARVLGHAGEQQQRVAARLRPAAEHRRHDEPGEQHERRGHRRGGDPPDRQSGERRGPEREDGHDAGCRRARGQGGAPAVQRLRAEQQDERRDAGDARSTRPRRPSAATPARRSRRPPRRAWRRRALPPCHTPAASTHGNTSHIARRSESTASQPAPRTSAAPRPRTASPRTGAGPRRRSTASMRAVMSAPGSRAAARCSRARRCSPPLRRRAPSAAASSSPIVPRNTSRPRSSRIASSHAAATSSTRWVETTTQLSPPTSRSSRRKLTRCSGSSPAVGSSSSRILGSLTIACAIPTRRTIPPDSVFIRLSARSASPTRSSARSTAAGIALARHLLQPRHVLDELARGVARVEAEALRQVADVPADLAQVAAVRVDADEAERAGVRSRDGRQRLHQRRLAGAVGAEQAVDAGVERQVEALAPRHGGPRAPRAPPPRWRSAGRGQRIA